MKKKPLVWITRAQYTSLAVNACGKSEIRDMVAPYPTNRQQARAARLHAEHAEQNFLALYSGEERKLAEQVLEDIKDGFTPDFMALYKAGMKLKDMLLNLYTSLAASIPWDSLLHGVLSSVKVLLQYGGDVAEKEVALLYRKARRISPSVNSSPNQDFFTIHVDKTEDEIMGEIKDAVEHAKYLSRYLTTSYVGDPTKTTVEELEKVVKCYDKLLGEGNLYYGPARIALLQISLAVNSNTVKEAFPKLRGIIAMLALNGADDRVEDVTAI